MIYEAPRVFTDMLGQEVRVGDIVAYATGRGANAELKTGEVRELTWSGGCWTWKVWALKRSPWRGYLAIDADARKPSEPTRGRSVRISKGGGW